MALLQCQPPLIHQGHVGSPTQLQLQLALQRLLSASNGECASILHHLWVWQGQACCRSWQLFGTWGKSSAKITWMLSPAIMPSMISVSSASAVDRVTNPCLPDLQKLEMIPEGRWKSHGIPQSQGQRRHPCRRSTQWWPNSLWVECQPTSQLLELS